MESTPEKQPAEVIYKNEPRMFEGKEGRRNDQRKEIASGIEGFIKSSERFKDGKVEVTFSHAGVSSLVCFLEIADEKFVLKIPLSATQASGESQFLKAWERVGVAVPHIIEEGEIVNHPYMLYAYIDKLPLSKAFTPEEWRTKRIAVEMGRILRQMHLVEAEGYGPVVNGHAEFSTFESWIQGKYMSERIQFTKDNSLLDEHHGSIDEAIQTLADFTKKDPRSTYCHMDFGWDNMFATDPFTVIDPNPMINHPYMDIARTVILSASGGTQKGTLKDSELVQGYFGNEKYDEKALKAFIIINVCTKFFHWSKMEKTKQIKNVQKYLDSILTF
jgi:aminoglycoside phosphotransferase (APT) family kinase protein